MEEILLDLTPHHVRRLSNGHTIQLKHHHIGHGVRVHLHHHKVMHIHRAHRNRRGVRINMDEHELHASGFWSKVKHGLQEGWKGYKKYVKPIVSKAIRKGLVKGIEWGAPAAATFFGAPEAAPAAAQIAHLAANDLVNAVGNKTGAYGVRRRRHPRRHTSGGKIHINWGKVKHGLQQGFEGYKKYVKPVVGQYIRKGLTKGAEELVHAVAPKYEKDVNKYIPGVVNTIGNKTGAYGVRQRKPRHHRLSHDYNTFISNQHPAMNPVLDYGGAFML